jgi:hypothetical protein
MLDILRFVQNANQLSMSKYDKRILWQNQRLLEDGCRPVPGVASLRGLGLVINHPGLLVVRSSYGISAGLSG